jgi:hypothetical protein
MCFRFNNIVDDCINKRFFLRCRLFFAFVFVSQLQFCPNSLREFSHRGGVEYRIEEARKYIDKLEYDDAIAVITPVLATNPKNAQAAYVGSSAYAGRAGLKILDLLLVLPSEVGVKGLFAIFAEHFVEVTEEDVEDLYEAVRILEAYSDDASERSPDMNFYALFLYYARIGALLNYHAYNESGELLENFSACHKEYEPDEAATGLPNDYVDTVMISLPRIIDATSGIASSGEAVDLVASADLTGVLGDDVPREVIPCSSAEGVTSDNLLCHLIRSFINMGPINGGIGLDTPTDGGSVVCAPQ